MISRLLLRQSLAMSSAVPVSFGLPAALLSAEPVPERIVLPSDDLLTPPEAARLQALRAQAKRLGELKVARLEAMRTQNPPDLDECPMSVPEAVWLLQDANVAKHHLAAFIGAQIAGEGQSVVSRSPVVAVSDTGHGPVAVPAPSGPSEPHIAGPRAQRPCWNLLRRSCAPDSRATDASKPLDWRGWRFSATCDPADGAVLRVVLARDAAPEQVTLRYPADTVYQLWKNNFEAWHAPLTQPPPVTLAQALAVVEKEFGAIQCALIVAHPVRWSEGGNEPRPAWSIDLRQMVSSATADMPVRDGSHLRHIVFADTGQWVTAINTPHDLSVVVPPVTDQTAKVKP